MDILEFCELCQFIIIIIDIFINFYFIFSVQIKWKQLSNQALSNPLSIH